MKENGTAGPKIAKHIAHIVLQPTTLCNLNCDYCYLPDRQKKQYMGAEIPQAIVDSLEGLDHGIQILWHGGEPLATGIKRFRELLMPFENLRAKKLIRHSLQTNATLINDEWCELFKEFEFHIGVSIDGPADLNKRRVGWNGETSFDSAIRGVKKLQERGIGFGVIAVVSVANVQNASEFYNFFRQLGCRSLSINIEEQEGLYRLGRIVESKQVRHFWDSLFQAWLACPELIIREFDKVMGWLNASSGIAKPEARISDLWPTISTLGDVVVVSPELMAVNPEEQERFIVGNVLNESLPSIVNRSLTLWYVCDTLNGVELCQQQCPYFSFCGGGQASNKYFETGSFLTTETAHCRNTKKTLVDAVIYQLSDKSTDQLQVQKGDAYVASPIS